MKIDDARVLVTGADGFIGNHLVERLLNRGNKVRAFVFYNAFNSWGWLDTLPKDILPQIDIFSGDIRDNFFPFIRNGRLCSMERIRDISAKVRFVSICL